MLEYFFIALAIIFVSCCVVYLMNSFKNDIKNEIMDDIKNESD